MSRLPRVSEDNFSKTNNHQATIKKTLIQKLFRLYQKFKNSAKRHSRCKACTAPRYGLQNLRKSLVFAFSKKSAFTLVEILVAISIFITLMGTVTAIYFSMQKSQLRIKMSSNLYDETRFLMESLAKEIRGSYIDYEEFYNQNNSKTDRDGRAIEGSCELNCENSKMGGNCSLDDDIDGDAMGIDLTDKNFNCSGIKYNTDELFGEIGRCYGAYARNFYEPLGSKKGICSRDMRATGGADGNDFENALASHQNQNLYLISLNRMERTFFRFSDNALKKLKLICCETSDTNGCSGLDGNNNEICEQWGPDPDFTSGASVPSKAIEDHFVDITSSDISIADLDFYIYPRKDPYLAFKDHAVKYHPFVRITIQAFSRTYADHFPNEAVPSISLSTTISVRSYSNIPSLP